MADDNGANIYSNFAPTAALHKIQLRMGRYIPSRMSWGTQPEAILHPSDAHVQAHPNNTLRVDYVQTKTIAKQGIAHFREIVENQTDVRHAMVKQKEKTRSTWTSEP